MEDSVAKDQSSASGRSTSRLLRYPLRSAMKAKEEKPSLADSSNSASATKRGRVASTVTKSVSALDLSSKEKSGKPPRRLSVPSKSNASPTPKSFGNVTPISEARAKRTAGNQGKSDTPASDSKSSNRKKFSVLSSASYWLSQIKLSESAAKHSISLGFFKLALEAGCEPVQRISDELKQYVRRHNLSELGESVKELFESYKIPENLEQFQESGTCQLPDDDVNSSSSSITDAEKLKPLDMDAEETDNVKIENNKTTQKDDSVKGIGRSLRKNAASTRSGSGVRGRNNQNKPQKPIKKEPEDKDKVKNQGKKSASSEGPLDPPPERALQEDKENMVAPQMEEITPAEA